MKRKILIVISVLLSALSISVLCIWYVHASAINTFLKTEYNIVYNFRTLPESVQKEFLATIRIRNLLGIDKEQWEHILRQRQKSEEEIKVSVARLQACADAMSTIADPGEPVNLSDVIEEPLPNKQLIFAGIAEKSCFLYYVQGGFAICPKLVVYSHNERSAWVLFERDLFDFAEDLEQLRKAVLKKPPRYRYTSN